MPPRFGIILLSGSSNGSVNLLVAYKIVETNWLYVFIILKAISQLNITLAKII